MSNCDDIRLFCVGYYAEIMVMDPFSLEVIFSLSSKVKPDWISALHVSLHLNTIQTVCERTALLNYLHRCWDHRNVKTMLFWLSVPLARWKCGHWLETRTNIRSRFTRTSRSKYGVWMRSVWTAVPRINVPFWLFAQNTGRFTMLVGSEMSVNVKAFFLKLCHRFSPGDFTVLCSVISPSGERWLGGDFLANDRVILWSDEGKGYMYRLPAKWVNLFSFLHWIFILFYCDRMWGHSQSTCDW